MIRQEFTMMYTKFLIEEQTNRKNDYLHSAFNVNEYSTLDKTIRADQHQPQPALDQHCYHA
jgi:hypothetical protein